jgi:catechol 2,3-dioxygenase-like lactoylglutathione lyase family enzyme
MESHFPQAVTFLYVSDLEQASKFWGDILSLPLALTQRPPDGTKDVARIFAVSSSAYIGCVLADPKSKSGTGVTADGVVFTLVTSEVDQWADRLQRKGVALEKGPVLNERYNIYHIFFRDPDGHLCEIQEFRDPVWLKLPEQRSLSRAYTNHTNNGKLRCVAVTAIFSLASLLFTQQQTK